MRKACVVTECPVSLISAESISQLEQFHVWKLAGKGELSEYPARTVEAFAVLENLAIKEGNHAEQ